LEGDMLVNGRMGKGMVREHQQLPLLDISMLGSGRMGNIGTEQDTTTVEK